MKQLVYTPKACQEGGDFIGGVTLRLPSFDERYEALDELGIKVNKDGEIEMSDMNSFKAVRSLVKMCGKYFVSVDIKHKDGREFKSKEDLESDPECDGILIEIAMNLSKGFRPTKN